MRKEGESFFKCCQSEVDGERFQNQRVAASTKQQRKREDVGGGGGREDLRQERTLPLARKTPGFHPE